MNAIKLELRNDKNEFNNIDAFNGYFLLSES